VSSGVFGFNRFRYPKVFELIYI